MCFLPPLTLPKPHKRVESPPRLGGPSSSDSGHCPAPCDVGQLEEAAKAVLAGDEGATGVVRTDRSARCRSFPRRKNQAERSRIALLAWPAEGHVSLSYRRVTCR